MRSGNKKKKESIYIIKKSGSKRKEEKRVYKSYYIEKIHYIERGRHTI